MTSRASRDKLKSPNVGNVLEWFDNIAQEIPQMNKSERKELAGYLTAMADAFNADAPEDLKIPGVTEVTMNLADLSRTALDTFGLGL